jgi:hypothetical protein
VILWSRAFDSACCGFVQETSTDPRLSELEGSSGSAAEYDQRREIQMGTPWKFAASALTVIALALIAMTAAAAAANPHQRYTCTKSTPNGNEVQVNVPEPAVAGLSNAGFTCVPNAPAGDDPPGEDPGGEDPGGEDPGGEDPGGDDAGNTSGPASSPSGAPAPQGQRALFCSANGPAFRANGEGMGVALNLLDEQGALLVELGLASPAMYYQGIGASCDVLPGFTYANRWVDHVGDVVSGVAIYPLFVRASG